MPKVTKTTKKASPLLDEETVPVETTETEAVENTDETIDTPVEKVASPKKEVTGSAKVNIQAEMKSDIEKTRLALANDEQVNFMIPLAQGEKAGAFEDIWINGYHVRVPKGRMSILPKAIVDILANKYSVEAEAGQEFRLDLNPEKHDKVS